jgi:hypothetical protein
MEEILSRAKGKLGAINLMPELLIDSREDAYAAMISDAAIRTLEGWGLVQADGNLLVMHQLTYAITGELRRDNLSETRHSILSITRDLILRS